MTALLRNQGESETARSEPRTAAYCDFPIIHPAQDQLKRQLLFDTQVLMCCSHSLVYPFMIEQLYDHYNLSKGESPFIPPLMNHVFANHAQRRLCAPGITGSGPELHPERRLKTFINV